MSRIGKKPIEVPSGVTVTIDGSQVTVKGPKGELTQAFDPDMAIKLETGTLAVERPTDQRRHRALHGLTRALLNNMIEGVTQGFVRRLEIVGTGYGAEMDGKVLKLRLGYSHDILVVPPDGMSFKVEGQRGNFVIIEAIDKQLIGQVAADIRKLRPPEPYQGKGIRYEGEYVRQKAGKAGKLGK